MVELSLQKKQKKQKPTLISLPDNTMRLLVTQMTKREDHPLRIRACEWQKDLFQVAYVVIKMANSPRPGIWIFVSLLNDRPSAKNFFNSTVLQEFTRATSVRLRLLRAKTLLGHLMSVARQDPTVTRGTFTQ
ncbi:hypothetical protein Avbf_08457 [Armadillidium vulgare]|nr:hypothetical protein Avbf_08457 [Armadillidium vulgare]